MKKWKKPLPDGFMIYKELHTFLGMPVAFSVVLVKVTEGKKEGITRYDTAHDCVHRDLLGRSRPKEVIDKIWYPKLTLKEGFNHADRDFSENYATHYAYYASH
jgi:hypothetical protein